MALKILVTGATGTIGTPLCAELERRGFDVYRTDLQHHGIAKYMRCDVADYRQVEAAVEWAQPNVVYHLAAEFGRMNGEAYYEQVWRTNAIGTRNVLEVQRRDPFELIFASSSEIYGDIDAPKLWESLSDDHALHQSNDYAISKWVNEQQCQNFRARYGNSIMVLRFFNAYGPGERFHAFRSVVCLFCHAALTGTPITVYRDYHRVFMYIDDFIPTLANAVDGYYDGVTVNIGGREFRSVEELAGIIWDQTGADPALISYASIDQHNVKDKRPSIEVAESLLKHDPKVTLEDGVARTLAWMARELGTVVVS